MSEVMVSGALEVRHSRTGRIRIRCLAHGVSTRSPRWWSLGEMARWWNVEKFEADHAACRPPRGSRTGERQS